MAERRPLVRINGRTQELPAGDTLPDVSDGGHPIYVGPEVDAPVVTQPTLMVFRELGTPAGTTSLIVREP